MSTIGGTLAFFEGVLGDPGSAGSVLRPQGSSGRKNLGRCAPRNRMFASRADSGPIPLRCDLVLRPQGSSGRKSLGRCAPGNRVFASRADYGPIPLRCELVLRPQGGSRSKSLGRCVPWNRMFASRAGSGPIPLRRETGSWLQGRSASPGADLYWKNPRMAAIARSTWSSVSSGYIGNGWMRRLIASATG